MLQAAWYQTSVAIPCKVATGSDLSTRQNSCCAKAAKAPLFPIWGWVVVQCCSARLPLRCPLTGKRRKGKVTEAMETKMRPEEERGGQAKVDGADTDKGR